MARFHLDHNVSHQIAELLRTRGHDVLTAWDLGLMFADDDVHLWTAADDNRIVVTHNRDDFRLLHKAWHRWFFLWTAAQIGNGISAVKPSHSGIIVVPQAPHLSPAAVATEIDALVARVSLVDQFYWYDWQSGRGWMQEPPL